MRVGLPENHGLTAAVLSDHELMPRTKDGDPSLTDIQFDALSAGVAHGESILVVAPTSTGKTNIAIWALLGWLFGDLASARTVVYLVTHRALARQKFQEFQSTLVNSHFGGDRRALVLATGDGIVDANGDSPASPLDAPLMVATYEKYLAMLAGMGMKKAMSDALVICDEVQIIGDDTRGRNIEVLLTLLSKAKIGQLVALSAVIELKDADALAGWLGVKLVRVPTREKHLIYQCRTPTRKLVLSTENSDRKPAETPFARTEPGDGPSYAAQLYRAKQGLPAVVFCMSRRQIHEGVELFCKQAGLRKSGILGLLEGLIENTQAARDLSWLLDHRVAFHTADMLEEERHLVEERLKANQIDVVFSTTTLAAGVNFPFSTAIFSSWKRFDGEARAWLAIPNNEFQNMAGRAGRMGFSEGNGSVVFFADDAFQEMRTISGYLQPDALQPLRPQVDPKAFGQVALQLVSSGMCGSNEDIIEFLLATFSAYRERDSNRAGLEHWREKTEEAVSRLLEWGFVI